MAIYGFTVHWWLNWTKLDRNINKTCAKVFIIITTNDAIDLNCSHCVNMMDAYVRKYNWNKWFLRLYYFCLFTGQMLSAYCGGTHVEWYLEMCFLMKVHCIGAYANYRILIHFYVPTCITSSFYLLKICFLDTFNIYSLSLHY